MSTEFVLLLLLGLSISKGENRKHIARLNGISSTQITQCTSLPIADKSLSLETIIRAVVNGDWKRVGLVLQMGSEACTQNMRHAVYEALWLEWQQDKQIYDPLKILDFHQQLEQQSDVPTTLSQNIYQAFVSRSAQLLSAPFHTDSRSAEFPEINTLLSKLSTYPVHFMSDILETLFDDVLSSESTQSVAQRLGNLNATLTQLTMANLQLLNRSELHFNSTAHTILVDNLRQLLKEPSFKEEVEPGQQFKVRLVVLSKSGFQIIPPKVYLRKANDKQYLSECQNTMQLCTQEQEYTHFEVHRVSDEFGSRFAFQIPDWNARYLAKYNHYVSTVSTGIYWWHVVRVKNGAAIYDASLEYVICGEGDNQLADMRHANNFDDYHDECTWLIEDCNSC